MATQDALKETSKLKDGFKVNGEMTNRVKKNFDLINTANPPKLLREPDLNFNIAFYLNKQWLDYSISQGLQEASMPKRIKKRFTLNVVTPMIDTVTAMINSSSVHMKVEPNTNTWRDLEGASMANMVLKSEVWDRLKLKRVIKDVNPLLACSEYVIMMPYFNPEAGEVVKADEINGMFGDGTWKEDKHKGQLELDIVSQFEFRYSSGAQTINDEGRADWIAKSKIYSTQHIEQRTGIKVDGVQRRGIRVSEAFEAWNINLNNAYNMHSEANLVLVHELYHRPCAEYPKGYYIAFTNKGQELAFMDHLPWGIDYLPAVRVRWKGIHGRFEGICPMTEARGLQREINISKTEFMNYKSKYMFPPWFVPRDSGVSENQLVNKALELVYYTPSAASDRGGAPHMPQMPMFNEQFLNHIKDTKMAIAEIFGVSQIVQGVGGDMSGSGRGLSMLLSAGDTRVTPLITEWEEALTELGRMCLDIICKTYDMPRLIKCVGEANAREIKQFTGDMLNGNINVKVKMASALPLNKQMAADLIGRWRQDGTIPATEDGQRMTYKMLDLESYQPLTSASKEEEQVKYENSILDDGFLGEQAPVEVEMEDGSIQPSPDGAMEFVGLPINAWDDHRLHIKIHEDRQKELNYIRLIKDNPKALQAYDLHMAQHNNAIIAMERSLAAEQAQLNGGGQDGGNVDAGTGGPIEEQIPEQ